jgi:hypothetical protein
MTHTTVIGAVSGGLLESLSQAVVAVATLLFALMIVAFASYAYKSLRGDGIEWPDDRDGTDTGGGRRWDPDPGEADDESGTDAGDGTDGSEGVRRGDDDDEWDFY